MMNSAEVVRHHELVSRCGASRVGHDTPPPQAGAPLSSSRLFTVANCVAHTQHGSSGLTRRRNRLKESQQSRSLSPKRGRGRSRPRLELELEVAETQQRVRMSLEKTENKTPEPVVCVVPVCNALVLFIRRISAADNPRCLRKQ